MKYSIPHEAVRQVSRTIPQGEFDPRVTAFSKLKGAEKKTRLLSVAAYLGLAPFLWLSGVNHQQNRVLKHHMLYSLGLSFVTLCAVVWYLFQGSITYSIFTYFWRPTLAEFDAAAIANMAYTLIDMALTFVAIVAWVSALLICLVGAMHGRTPQINLFSWLTSKPWVVRTAVLWTLIIEVLIFLLLGLGLRSIQLAEREQPPDAKVYVLYTIGGYIPLPVLGETFTPPRWMVTMAFYPTVKAGMETFGEDGVALLPLTEENFSQAVRTGKFIFVASHGGASSGSFTLSMRPHIQYSPSNVDPANVGEDLQFAYFAGCFTGDLEAEWNQTLHAEELIMFDRISFVDEHMLWVWLKSPGVIKNLQ